MNPKGFGFVTVEGEEEDFYISSEHISNAFNMDTVEIELLKSTEGEKRNAKIVSVKERANESIIGTFKKKKKSGIVVPDDPRLPREVEIPADSVRSALDGQKVECLVTSYGWRDALPRGQVSEVLGFADDPGVDIYSVIRRYGVPVDFPGEVLEEAGRVSKKLTKKDLKGRVDLTSQACVTIDGDDTKDFDDAVSIRREGEDYILGVHIADVSHYVTEGSALDKEARVRGTSIYLPDRVIPMLPEELCNDMCSLKEQEPRLAISCVMRINPKGRVVFYDIFESVICVRHRMTYNDVNEILDHGDRRLCVKYADMLGDFYLMQDLAMRIRARRKKRGAVDFEFPEAKLKIDEKGRTRDVVVEQRGFSQRMIEDFMLSANETVAKEFCKRKIPFIYRNHVDPDSEKLIALRKVVRSLGIPMERVKKKVTPKDIQALLERIHGLPEEDFISTLVLRSMQRAEYGPSNEGHFGLAAEYYTHFTSPIRRYPDLMIHRILKEELKGKLKKKKRKFYEEILPELTNDNSISERRAESLERDVCKLKMIEYMSDHVGQRYSGRVSGVTAWGIYVELENTIEGLVPMRLMTDDYYDYAPESYEVVGRHSGRRFRLGDVVNIRVEYADKDSGMLDFSLTLPREERPKVQADRKKRHSHGSKKHKAYRKK